MLIVIWTSDRSNIILSELQRRNRIAARFNSQWSTHHWNPEESWSNSLLEILNVVVILQYYVTNKNI